MAKMKSPNYPKMDLGAALKLAPQVYDKDGRNKVSQAALAAHIGHKSVSGPALSKIGALRAYGLVEGAGDELRVSEAAVTALMAPEGTEERSNALTYLAWRPKLFQEIRNEFANIPSLENLKFWLIKRAFHGDAAETAALAYLETLRLAGESLGSYNSAPTGEEESDMQPSAVAEAKRTAMPSVSPVKPGMLQEVFNLDEGPVTVTFPENLSTLSYEDLKDHFDLFLRKAKRKAERHVREEFGQDE